MNKAKSMRYTSIFPLLALLILLPSVAESQSKDEDEINRINPFFPYLSEIEWKINNPMNSIVQADILSTLRKMHPNLGIFDYAVLQEKAGSDPFFIREFTKKQIERRGETDAKLALYYAFGLSATIISEIFENPNFGKFLSYKSQQEIAEATLNEQNEIEERKKTFDRLVKNNLEPYLPEYQLSNSEVLVHLDPVVINVLKENAIHSLYAYFDDDGKCKKTSLKSLDSINDLVVKNITLSKIPYVEIDSIQYQVKSSFHINLKETKQLNSGNTKYIISTKQAQFPGGLASFYEFVESKLLYPLKAKELGVSGNVYIQFLVQSDGTLTDITVVKGLGAGCDEEAVRVLSKCPNFIPVKNTDGEAVISRIVLPIRFNH